MYGPLPGLLIFVLLTAFAISLLAISLLVNAAQQKGFHRNDAGTLWFVGIFASPIVLGLYTASLPDRGAPTAPTQEDPRDELPTV